MSGPQDTISQTSMEKILEWQEKPQVMVRELFGVTPDPWQDEVLRSFPTTPRIAMKASVGPGKSCVMAWLGWNFLLTRPYPNIAATSISGDNLRDGLWKEMSVWRNKSPLLERAFERTSERIYAKGRSDTWFMSARTWPQTADETRLGVTLAGLHSDYMLVLVDESGGVPPALTARAEAIFSSAKEAHIVQAGNTNMLSGALYVACVKHPQLWKVVVISGDPDDPNRSPRVSLEWAREMIKTYGRDHPYVKVSVLGEWPPASYNALIGPDEVEAAMKRAYREFEYGKASKILGVDVGRSATGDPSVIFPRQGLVAFQPSVYRGVDSIQGAGLVARKWTEWDADACFIDNTGGFGAGWIDQLRLLGRQPIPVQYSGEPHNKERYVNKRTEMYLDAVQWIKEGGQLPPVPELTAALSQTCYFFKGDKMILEPKEIVAQKIGHSPDHADAFVETFAEPVMARAMQAVSGSRQSRVMKDYDAFAEFFGN
jgi:hypothetical protein